MLSERRRRFYNLVRQAHEQPSDWLIRVLKHPERPDRGPVPALARLACLRILACRNQSGLPYPQRKALVREELGLSKHLPQTNVEGI